MTTIIEESSVSYAYLGIKKKVTSVHPPTIPYGCNAL